MTQTVDLPTIEQADGTAKRGPLRQPEFRSPLSPAELSRKRFTTACVVGTTVVVPFLLWLSWDLFNGTISPLRAVPYDDFYELQARAMFHGHLWIPKASLGIEAFLHDGHAYTYFGLFPSILRMPILLVTSSFDGRLTAPFLILAWLSTAVLSALMLWRLRVLMRGDALVGRMEATAFGVLMTTIMGGSVILFLVATPFIYNEDFAWSVPLTVGSLFYLLGMLERPSRRAAVVSFVFVLCANLDRTPTGYACTLAALLVAGWFALGRAGEEHRRWAIPMAAVGLVPFFVSCAVTYAKFGIPIGLPMADQVWASVNAHRRYFLAANGGKAFSLAFLPSTLWAYLQPFGIRFSNVFPFISPPASPASWLGGVVLDQTYPTASLPATSPSLFVLACWGTITAFRPRGWGRIRLARFVLLGAVAGSAGVLLWGYISERYIADLMPFFIIASGIGLIDVWRRLSTRSPWTQRAWLAVLGAIAVYSVAATVAISAFPVPSWWSFTAQDRGFVSAVESYSIGSIKSDVLVGRTLPYWAPAGTVFATPNCSGIYLSSGAAYKDVPGQYVERYEWMPVEQSNSFNHVIDFTFNKPVRDFTSPITILRYGPSTLVLERLRGHYFQFQIENSGTSINWPPSAGFFFSIVPGQLHKKFRLTIRIDPNLHSITIYWFAGVVMLNHYLAGNGPAVVETTAPNLPASAKPAVSVSIFHYKPRPPLPLCPALLRNR